MSVLVSLCCYLFAHNSYFSPFCFSFFVLLLSLILSRIWFLLVLVSLCCYLQLFGYSLWNNMVLVSLCCYNDLPVIEKWNETCFSFFVLLLKKMIAKNFFTVVLVSLCCYLLYFSSHLPFFHVLVSLCCYLDNFHEIL